MFIKSFFLHDAKKNITVSEINFEKLNVLVGTSGAGKTTIMHGLYTISQIANGTSSPHTQWKVVFLDNDGRTVSWQGRFSSEIELEDDKREIAELLEEHLSIDEQVVVKKSDGKTVYKNTELPILDKNKSNVYLLREDASIKAVFQSLLSMIIVLNNSRLHTENKDIPVLPSNAIGDILNFYKENQLVTIQELHKRISNISCRWRLLLSEMLDKPSFDELCLVYTSIFPNVKSIRLRMIISETDVLNRHGLIVSLNLVDGTEVHQYDISSGMFKTLMLLSELMLSSDNTVLLIDELENSLGVNCLPDIIQEIKSAKFQCIVSTHHPKIINDIPVKHWKIVNRKGGEIHVDNATALEQSSSHHDKFIQLINSSIYKNGNA